MQCWSWEAFGLSVETKGITSAIPEEKKKANFDLHVNFQFTNSKLTIQSSAVQSLYKQYCKTEPDSYPSQSSGSKISQSIYPFQPTLEQEIEKLDFELL